MGLSMEETRVVYSLLKSEQRPLDEIVAEFSSKITRPRLYAVSYYLLLILKEKKMLKSTERLIAFTILRQIYSSQQSSANPFLTSLINAACDEEAGKCERAFVLQLLGLTGTGGNEFLKQSVANYIKVFDPSAHAFPQQEQLQHQYCDKVHPEPHKCLFEDVSMKNIILDPDVPPNCDASSQEFDLQPGAKFKLGSGDRDEILMELLSSFSLEGISPQWNRPRPPILPIQDGELVWLNPDNSHELVWDHGMCADTSRGAAVKDLITKALKGPLAPSHQEVPFVYKMICFIES
uniref:CCR4-NOT transcription complex subunit 11 n=1 Tax=Rhizophora mucronata TaxID=61149 RepID=A0A2P2L0S3_RHIMU